MEIPLKEAKVIHSGIDTKKFSFESRSKINYPIRFIYPARIEQLKGQTEAIQLVSQLRNYGLESQLTIIGPISSNEYHQKVIDKVSALNLEESVTFLPMISQDTLVDLYHRSDILFFPTFHQMGFSRVPLEAMACGCIVISYGNEASNEIIQNGQNGFLSEPGDFKKIIQIIKLLHDSPNRFETIIRRARREVEQDYSIEKYVERIETFIKKSIAPH